jgi:type IV fimbrial biogenesis protein FimT
MIELMSTLGILGVVTALAVPNFRDFMLNNRAADEANALVGALNLARSEAVTRGTPVSVCASDDGEACVADGTSWADGWIVFTDADADGNADGADTVLRVQDALREGSSLESDALFVNYAATGFIGTAGATLFDLEVEGCTNMHNRSIALNPQGRTVISRTECGG